MAAFRSTVQAHQHLQKLAEQARHRGDPFHILIADDERWVREVFRDYCSLSDAFDIDLAHGGADAVDRVRHKHYDLITLDLIMPEVSGLDALAAIKTLQPHVPVMIITGNASDKLIREAGVLGACKVMHKPVLLEDFLSELASRLIHTDNGNGRH